MSQAELLALVASLLAGINGIVAQVLAHKLLVKTQEPPAVIEDHAK